jgi:hypothetical protein
LNLVVLAHGRIDQRNALRLAVGGDDAAAMALLELGDAAGVIRMVMGDEDVAASGASIAAVAPLSGSCRRTPKLSLRQRNRRVCAGMWSSGFDRHNCPH